MQQQRQPMKTHKPFYHEICDFFSSVIFSPVTSKLAYAVSVESITELWEPQALGGYATTEINVYELIKISSMTSYYKFAILGRTIYIVWLFGACVVWVDCMCRTCGLDFGELRLKWCFHTYYFSCSTIRYEVKFSSLSWPGRTGCYTLAVIE